MQFDLQHGGALDRMHAAFPDAPKPWIDLSTGINPWAYPLDRVDPDLAKSLPTRAAYQACVQALASAIGATAEAICLGPGSELLIRSLPLFLKPKRVAILAPTYGDHAEVWQRTGCQVVETSDPLAMADQADLVVLCNPNNPDGRTFSPDALLNAASTLSERSGILVIDEAYCDLTPELSLAPYAGREGLIVLRSFGKFYGLPGLRLGAVLAPTSLRTALQAHLGVWPISSLALEAGRHAYCDQAWQIETRARLSRARADLDQRLEASGLKPLGGTDLFRYVHVEPAHAVWRHLAEHGISVRRFEDRVQYLRIGLPANERQAVRLSEALSLLA